MATIIDVLKNNDARLSIGRSWLVWDEASKEWQVYNQPYGYRPYLYGKTTSQAKAVQLLFASIDPERAENGNG